MKQLILISAILVFVAGCKKDNDTLPPVTGSVYGFVELFDEFGRPINAAKDVNVTAGDGSSTFTAVANDNGRFEISNAKAGAVDITVTKRAIAPLAGMA